MKKHRIKNYLYFAFAIISTMFAFHSVSYGAIKDSVNKEGELCGDDCYPGSNIDKNQPKSGFCGHTDSTIWKVVRYIPCKCYEHPYICGAVIITIGTVTYLALPDGTMQVFGGAIADLFGGAHDQGDVGLPPNEGGGSGGGEVVTVAGLTLAAGGVRELIGRSSEPQMNPRIRELAPLIADELERIRQTEVLDGLDLNVEGLRTRLLGVRDRFESILRESRDPAYSNGEVAIYLGYFDEASGLIYSRVVNKFGERNEKRKRSESKREDQIERINNEINELQRRLDELSNFEVLKRDSIEKRIGKLKRELKRLTESTLGRRGGALITDFRDGEVVVKPNPPPGRD